MDHHTKEKTEMLLRLDTISYDRDFKLNQTWNLTIRFSYILSHIKEHLREGKGYFHPYHVVCLTTGLDLLTRQNERASSNAIGAPM